MTAYRQRALACAAALAQGPRRPRDLKADLPDAPKILRAMSMGGSSPSSGESIPWPSQAEPRFCGGRSPHRRSQSINASLGGTISHSLLDLTMPVNLRHRSI